MTFEKSVSIDGHMSMGILKMWKTNYKFEPLSLNRLSTASRAHKNLGKKDIGCSFGNMRKTRFFTLHLRLLQVRRMML